MPLVAHLRAAVVALHLVLVIGAVFGGARDVRAPDVPLDLYAAYCGVSQRWFMFKGVAPDTARIEIAVVENGVWRDIYAERSPTMNWNAQSFDHYRWREAMNEFRSRRRARGWSKFVEWTKARVFEEFPDASRVRIRVMRAPLHPVTECRRVHHTRRIRQHVGDRSP